jgi:hypothetical protein
MSGRRWVLMALAVTVSATQQQAPPPKTSYTLIDEALAAKRINEETAHKYRVFAAFGDSRLPEQYRGDDGGLDASPVAILDAIRSTKEFSAQTQAELRPFVLRPATPGSWTTLSTVKQDPADGPSELSGDRDSGPSDGPAEADPWYTVLAAGGKVKIWAQRRYAGDTAKADVLAREMTSRIWPDLVGLFWEPLPDGNLDDNGGGPELDVYLVRPNFSERRANYNQAKYGRSSWAAIAMFADPVHHCGESPHYILLDSRRPLGSDRSSGLLQDLAHEFTHAVTGRKPLKDFNCEEYAWIREATGAWGEHFVYPNAQSEQPMAHHFLDDPARPLDAYTESEQERHHYGAYLFPLSLMFRGRLQSMPKMWENFGRMNSLPGVDNALKATGKDLQETFPLFAVDNWNRATANRYDRVDKLATVAKVWPDSFAVHLTTGDPYEKSMFMGMKYLATEYVLFRFDNTVKAVTFENTLTPIPFAGVWVIEKIKGTWKDPDDWTSRVGKTWCRDNRDEDIEELAIIFTNKQWQNKDLKVDPGSHRPVVKAYPTGCTGWTGTTSTTNILTTTSPNLTITETVTSTMRFVPDSSFNRPGRPREYWKVVSGSISWRSSVTGECTGGGQGGVAIRDLDDKIAVLNIWEEDRKMHVSGGNGPWPGDIPRYQITCPNAPQPRTDMILFAALGWFNAPPEETTLSTDGRSFGGNFTSNPSSENKVSFQYRFTASP